MAMITDTRHRRRSWRRRGPSAAPQPTAGADRDGGSVRTITATYRNALAAFNCVDELINRGVPREQIDWKRGDPRLTVVIPAACEPEVNEVLVRHRPAALSGSSGRVHGSFDDSPAPGAP